MGEGKNPDNALFQSKPTVPDKAHWAQEAWPCWIQSWLQRQSTGQQQPQLCWSVAVWSHQFAKLCHEGEHLEKNLIYASFSPEQLLSAVSETRVTTFRFVKKTIEPNAL